MKQIFLSLISLFSITAFAQDTNVITDPTAIKRELSGSFKAISVTDGIDLFLTQGNSESVSVSVADERYLERFKTVLEDGTLRIFYDKKVIGIGINGKKKLKAYVTFKILQKLTASSGADVFAKTSIEVGDLEMKFTSGAHFDGKVTAKNFTVEQNSGSGIVITGKSEKINVDCSSGAIFKGYGFEVDNCTAKASSGAGVHITVNKELIAKANSGGGIRYKGSGMIKDINISSGGMVKKEN